MIKTLFCGYLASRCGWWSVSDKKYADYPLGWSIKSSNKCNLRRRRLETTFQFYFTWEDTLKCHSFHASQFIKSHLVMIRASQDVDILAILDLWGSRSRRFSRTSLFSYCPPYLLVWDENQESQDGQQEFWNPGNRGHRHPAEAWSWS